MKEELSKCEVMLGGEWHKAKWFDRVVRGKRAWHRVKLICQAKGQEILIPACGLYVRRSQIKGKVAA